MTANPVEAGRHGRAAQRRRTRKAIVDAAMSLLADDHPVSIEAVAKAADVSRRTVYMHFPSLEQLLIDATAGALSQASVEHVFDTSGDVAARVDGLVRTLQRMSPAVERLGRSLIRLTVEQERSDGGPRRGFRRVEWIEEALAPLRGRVEPRRLARLVSALAMVIGWEALLVQRDICGLTPAEGEALSRWAARALLDATLRENDRHRRRARGRKPATGQAR